MKVCKRRLERLARYNVFRFVADVYEYFTRACRRDRNSLRGARGEPVCDEDGTTAVFWIEAQAGRIAKIEYKCTTCMTLVALCEHLVELLPGVPLDQAIRIPADRLLALHPEIPGGRRGRAALAVAALQSAIQKYKEGAYT